MTFNNIRLNLFSGVGIVRIMPMIKPMIVPTTVPKIAISKVMPAPL